MKSRELKVQTISMLLALLMLIIMLLPGSSSMTEFVGQYIPGKFINPLTSVLLVTLILTVTGIYAFKQERKINNGYYQHGTVKEHRSIWANIGVSRNKKISIEKPKNAFAKVAGLEEPKRELIELLVILKNPEKYKKLGAKVPRGIILYGPPGTGKTLLSKSLAEEAEVEFIATSGSQFVEKYVGMGASRIRELFQKARDSEAGAIIYIDEIDSLGRKREGSGDNSIEKDQTLNQLLVEMDGFNSEKGNVIVIGSTNRLDMLDEALLRPGRFDRHIALHSPSFKERYDILKIHTDNKPMKDVALDLLAHKTAGMSGADLANVCNESAILAARNGREFIINEDVTEAVDRIVAGIENRSLNLSDREKRRIACHEAGHALAGILLGGEPVRRISILPRGQALGFTMQSPEIDKRLFTKSDLTSKLVVLMAGRAAEEIIFAESSSGASNDIQKATEIAINMVTELGMIDNHLSNCSYLLRSDPKLIHERVEKLIGEALDQAKQTLSVKLNLLMKMSDELFEKESMDEDDIKYYYSVSGGPSQI
jgi:cell division protease FtsH